MKNEILDSIKTYRDENLAAATTALKNGEFSKFKEYFEKGVDVNAMTSAVSSKGASLLHIAVIYNNFEAVKYLVENGADVNLLDDYYISAKLYAKRDGYQDIYEYLTSKGADDLAIINSLEDDYDDCEKNHGIIQCADALAKWEKLLMTYIEIEGVGERVLLNEIQASNSPRPSGFTISPSNEFTNGYIFQFISSSDRFFRGNFQLGNYTIIRFKGRVEFPCDISSNGMDGIYLGFSKDSQGGKNNTLDYCIPNSKSMIFDGDENDPLTFGLNEKFGFVYLHGKGKITRQNGEVIEIQ